MTSPWAARLVIALACLSLLAPAAHAEVEDLDDAQVWLSYAANGQISGDLAGSFDVNARFTDTASILGHFQVRGALGWRISQGFIIGGGYSYVRTENNVGRVANEHRIFQQASYPLIRVGTVAFTGRTRLEQRSFEEVDGTAWRLRQQIRATIPLRGPEGLRAIVHTEAFFLLNQLEAALTPTGLNQMRTFAGLGIPLYGKTAVDVGYLNQAAFPGADRYNHALSIGFTTAF